MTEEQRFYAFCFLVWRGPVEQWMGMPFNRGRRMSRYRKNNGGGAIGVQFNGLNGLEFILRVLLLVYCIVYFV